MQLGEQKTMVDLSNLYAIAGGDDTFVMALLSKMCKALPEAFANMTNFCAAKDWPALKSAAHKAKSTFAYLSLDDMKNRLRDIEHDAMEERDLDLLPGKVEEAVKIGNEILVQLKEALAKLM
ncbi:MAG TPA: Hpt domain-containing protein [Bacteroidia bacterium]|nr:Hpt domain-containing protein [Bacteroidia bacterium]